MRSIAPERPYVKTHARRCEHDLRTTVLLTELIEDVASVTCDVIASDFAHATSDGTMNGDGVRLSRRIKVCLDILKTLGELAYESWPTD